MGVPGLELVLRLLLCCQVCSMDNLVPSPRALLLQPQGARPQPAPSAPPAGPAGWSCLGHPLPAHCTAAEPATTSYSSFLFPPSLPPLLFLIFLSKKCLLAHLHKTVLPPASSPCPRKLSQARAQPDHELKITACGIPDHRL